MKERWQKLNSKRTGRYYGIVIDDSAHLLTNLRFADDILLTAGSRQDVAKMISDLAREAAKYGLKVHMGKTVVLTNTLQEAMQTVKCMGQNVRVAGGHEAERYLGMKMAMAEHHLTEVVNRLSSILAAFFLYKAALCHRRVPLADRVRLFDAVVKPCVLYACAT